MISRRSLLTGMLAGLVAVPAARIVRATEVVVPESGEYLWTSSWYEQLERGLWRQKSYRFTATTAPRLLVVNASSDAKEIAGVQLDWSWTRDTILRHRDDESHVFDEIPAVANSFGWVRGNVDVTNKNGVEIELTRDEESELIERGRRPTTIIRPEPSDLFGFFDNDGSFV